MFFYLTTLYLQKFIKEDKLVLSESTQENVRFLVIEAWKHSDFLCKNYILSGLEDEPYNVYSNIETSKELWDALEKKYKTEDVGFSKPVITQVQELQVIIHDLIAEGLVINEVFQVAAMIEKLPLSWRDFKNYLKHKRKEMKLEDLVIRLRIEEDNKAAERKVSENSTIMGVNIVETTPSNPKKRNKSSGPKNFSRKKKFKENCHNCGNIGHKAAECHPLKKEKQKGQANMVERTTEIYDLCAMVSECNLVGSPIDWWLDFGATRHVCVVREVFASYAPAGPNETMYMENASTTKTEGYEKYF